MLRHVPTTPLVLLLLAAPACGGKIAPEDASPAPVTAPTLAQPSTPTLAEYCSALVPSQCGEGLCVSESECRTSYTNASDAYLRAVVECRRDGQLTCAYPDTCVFERIGPTTATRAQVAVANAYCRSCFPDVDADQCRTAALRPESEGPTLSLGLRALADTAAERALECERTKNVLPTDYCPGDFITCLAKFRPIPTYTTCDVRTP